MIGETMHAEIENYITEAGHLFEWAVTEVDDIDVALYAQLFIAAQLGYLRERLEQHLATIANEHTKPNRF